MREDCRPPSDPVVASSKAEQVYHPILDARLKAERLRSTLGVFERNKFFFNLPGTLMESVEAARQVAQTVLTDQGRYEVALAAYKKGRYVSEYGAAQLLGRSAATAAITPLQEEQARRIIDKVWSEVERIVGDMRVTLGRRLKDPRTSIEDVEKTIECVARALGRVDLSAPLPSSSRRRIRFGSSLSSGIDTSCRRCARRISPRSSASEVRRRRSRSR